MHLLSKCQFIQLFLQFKRIISEFYQIYFSICLYECGLSLVSSLSLETIANLEKSCDYNTNNYFSGTIWEFVADIIVTNSKYLVYISYKPEIFSCIIKVQPPKLNTETLLTSNM